MAVPFRIGVMQLTMEPLEEMLASARAMDEAGMDTVWLAEAYPWWRKHQMEARGSTVVSALMARETTNLTIAWGIISPYTRHPVQVAMDARVVQEAAGPGRFIVGFGTSKIFLNNTKQGGPPKVTKPLAHMRDSVEIVRGILGGERFEYDGKVFSADIPALSEEAHAPRWDVPVYVAGTAPMMQQIGGEIGDGLLTPSITTPDYVRYTAGNIREGAAKSGRDPGDVDLGCTILASIHATDRDAGRDGAREIGGMYLANKVQNIQGSADVLLESAGIDQDEIIPVAEAMERGGRLAAKAQVTDALLDKCKPIAGTPERLHRGDRGVPRRRLHAHHARALGRGPARADPPLRRESAPTLQGRMSVSNPSVTVDRDRLVETAGRMIDVWSFTGDEQGMAELMVELYRALGLRVQWQQVEDNRANAVGTWPGSGDGKTLMFNGHMDTSYSGREEWLRDVPGFQPQHFVTDGRLYGLGVSNMKGALACYVEAVHALQDAGVRLRGDVMVAAVCGEIEKTQYGEAVGGQYRGYAAGSRYLVSHGGVADMCLLGEPTEGKVVLGHYGALWLRIRVHGNFIHTAFSEGRRSENAILRLHEVLSAVQEWIPTWEDDPANGYRGAKAIVNIGAIEGGFGWRVSRTPHHADLFLDIRVPPTKAMGIARREVLAMVRAAGGTIPRFRDRGRGVRHRTGRGDRRAARARRRDRCITRGGVRDAPERDVTRWFSDASALTRYGIPTVNYGTSTGLMDVEMGENLEIEGLVRTAEIYANVAMRVCGVA